MRKRIVIVGAGFGGMSAAHALKGIDAQVTMIDRTNYHLFQPLLYQVAIAALSPSDIATASRTLLRDSGVTVRMTEVCAIDWQAKRVIVTDGEAEPYDYLILAAGASYSFFGHDEWRPLTYVLKTLDDALKIRQHVLSRFEYAARSTDETEIRRMLTFVVVGGGPTGVELSGTIAELAQSVLPNDFKRIDPKFARIILCEQAPRLLSPFSQDQSAYAMRALEELKVEVRLNADVERIDRGLVYVGGEELASDTILWCAGTKSRPAAQWLGVDAAKNGAVPVRDDCSVPQRDGVFAIGDCASYLLDGKPLPGLAPVAKQQGKYVAGVLKKLVAGKAHPGAFRYRDWGTLAVIGRSRAVASFGKLRLEGFPAWISWALIHLALLIDYRSRVLVYVNWTWAWLTSNRGVRLIVDRGSINVDQ